MMNTASSFTSVLDGRKRKVRNLWQRGDRFYARIKIAYPGEERAKTRRVPLKAGNVTEAAKELCGLLVKRDKGTDAVKATAGACRFYRLHILRLLPLKEWWRTLTLPMSGNHRGDTFHQSQW